MAKRELLFLGPPASGKGTQTIMLAKEIGLPHVDTGSLLRAEIAAKTPEGLEAQKNIDQGRLAPAELVAKIIEKRLMLEDAEQGFILDGYPRSIEQAEFLDEIQKHLNVHFKRNENVIFKVFYFEMPFDELMDRIVYRRSCPNCGKIYNEKFTPPKVSGICDDCSTALTQRKDDTEEVAKVRFETYFEQTAPLVEYYTKKGVLHKIDARGTIDEVHKRLLKEVNN